MEKIDFENYPSTNSPINGTNLNLLQDNVEDALSDVKVLTFTRDSSAADGAVSYNGFGFKPKLVIALMAVDGQIYNSKGVTDGTITKNIYQISQAAYKVDNSFITFSNFSSMSETAFFQSFDDDGFTLSWSKFGNPTAVLQLIFIAFK